jgi:hypothetical protein
MITNTREVLDTTPADENNRMLLQIMAHARNIAGHFHSIGQADASNLPKG